MIHVEPTKRGIGVSLWGTQDDLNTLYDVIGKFWGEDHTPNIPGAENRNKLLGWFSYDLRKAYEGQRLTRKTSPEGFDTATYFGNQFTWVHFLFSLAAIKYNMNYADNTKLDVSMMLLVEHQLVNAMYAYDPAGAAKLERFTENALDGANEYIYHYATSINLDYLMSGGGKKAFRQLPVMLNKGIYFTEEYKTFKKFLENEAKKLGREVNQIGINDDFFDYEAIKW